MKATEEKEGGEDQFNQVGERRGGGELFLFPVLPYREWKRKRRDGSIQHTKDKYEGPSNYLHPVSPSPPLRPSLPPSVCCGFMLNNICAAAEAADSMQRFVATPRSTARSLHPQLCARRKMNLHRNRKISKRRAGGELIIRATSNPQTASNIHFLPAPSETWENYLSPCEGLFVGRLRGINRCHFFSLPFVHSWFSLRTSEGL